jgi:ankyrin repeat protein
MKVDSRIPLLAIGKSMTILCFLVGLALAAVAAADDPPEDLIEAANRGHAARVRQLINEKWDVNLNVGGLTPLIAACSLDAPRYVVVTFPDTKEEDGPISLGELGSRDKILQGKLEVANILIESGAEVEARTKDGRTPLFCAAYWGFTPLVELLLAKGAKIQAQTADGSTVLLACLRGPTLKGNQVAHYDSVAADGKLIVRQVFVPLEKERHQMVRLLLEGHQESILRRIKQLVTGGHPVDVNAEDASGNTALKLAKERGLTEIADLLSKHGAKD